MADSARTFDVEVLLPVHNEAETIEATIREIYEDLSKHVCTGFIICEDGSKDNTQAVIERVAGDIPMTLILSKPRKGYSRRS